MAQELTPRLYAPAPTGGNITQISYGRATGEVLFDPSLPLDDVNAAINTGTLLYGRTFGFLGRAANVGVATGFTTRIGADFDTFGFALQTVWFGKP